jgi:cytochrome c oxidase subunit 3
MAGDVKHDYHLVKPSPWPLLASLAMLLMVLGTAGAMKGLWFVEQGNWWGPVPGFIALVFVLIGWWGDVLKESRAGDHTEVVQISLRYGMVLFIASEVMFFVAWFWEFFEMAIYHTLRANPAHSDLANPAYESLLQWSGVAGDANRRSRREAVRPVPPPADQHADPAAFGHDCYLGAPRPAGG